MKAIIQDKFGGPDILFFREIDDAPLGTNDVRIEVHAVTVNKTLDTLTREGKFARPVRLPHILGVDPAGIIVEVGTNVTNRKTGDRVWVDLIIGCGKCEHCARDNDGDCTSNQMLGVQRWGGYAESCVVPARNTYRIPEQIPFAKAAAIARHFPTAMFLLEDQAKLKRDEWVLVMGASGGLGNAAVQVATYLGAKVIAAAGADERVQYALDAGAHFGVNYRSQDLEARVMEITEGRGVNVLCENVADPNLWPAAFNSLGRWGRLVTAGAHGGGNVTLDVKRLFMKSITIRGGPGPAENGVTRSFDMALKGNLFPGIAKIMPLSAAREAHRMVENKEVIGKLILSPALDKTSSKK